MEKAHRLENVIRKFVKAEFHKYLPNWVLTATQKERKGVEIITSIISAQGKRRFRAKSASISQRNYDAVAKQLRSRMMRTGYNEAFGSNIGKRTVDSDILRYKGLSNLPCSGVLTPSALTFLERWVQLGDDTEYQTLVLAALRSLFSVARIQTDVPTSSSRAYYKWKPSQARTSSAEGPRRALLPSFDLDSMNKTIDSTVSSPPYDPTIATTNKPDFTSSKRMKKRFFAGYGDVITSWISHTHQPEYSSYSRTFYTKNAKNKILDTTKARTSAVAALIPDHFALTKASGLNKTAIF